MTITDPSPDPRPPETDSTQPALRQHVVRSTRTSRTWTAVILFALVLILLLIFILQNGQRVKVSFLGFEGHLPLAVAMLFAAIAGALLIAIPGMGRMFQLRRVARRHRNAEAPNRSHGDPPSVNGAVTRPLQRDPYGGES